MTLQIHVLIILLVFIGVTSDFVKCAQTGELKPHQHDLSLFAVLAPTNAISDRQNLGIL